MKKGWQRRPLGELCDIRNGSTPSKGNPAFWIGGAIPWFTIDDIRSQGRSITTTRQKITPTALSGTSVKLLPVDSVLLCCTASVGEFAIARIPLTTNQQFNGLVVRDHSQLDPDFLFFYAATLKDELLELSGKTTIDFVPISRLRDIMVSFPPLPEQQRIVRILDEAFDGIATAKVNTEKNLQNARELFESALQGMYESAGKNWATLQQKCKQVRLVARCINLIMLLMVSLLLIRKIS
jgi:restriction endonuclease S subunit